MRLFVAAATALLLLMPSNVQYNFIIIFGHYVLLHKQSAIASSYIYDEREHIRSGIRAKQDKTIQHTYTTTHTNNKYYAYACVTKFTATASTKTLFTLILHIRNF